PILVAAPATPASASMDLHAPTIQPLVTFSPAPALQEAEEPAELAPPASETVAAPEAAPADEEPFEPVTAEDMEASLNDSADPFALRSPDRAACESAAAVAANTSSASIELSLNGSTLSAAARGTAS